MARHMALSSDDDLPDLASVLKSKPQSTKSRSREMTTKKSQPDRDHSRCDATGEETLALMLGGRRRILKPLTKNPLLLPFSQRDDEAKRSRTKVRQIEERIEPKEMGLPLNIEIPREINASSTMADHKSSSEDDNVFRDDIKGPNRKATTRESIREFTQAKKKTVVVKDLMSGIGSKQASYKKQELSEDEEVVAFSDGSSRMSDFVVEDQESFSEHSEDEEEDSILPSPLPFPKSARKLIRGRKPESRRSGDEDDIFGREDINELGDLISKIDIRKAVRINTRGGRDIELPKTGCTARGTMLPPTKYSTSLERQSVKFLPSSSFEQPSAILQFSPPRMKTSGKVKLSDLSFKLPPVTTPPTSLSKNPLRSPKKSFKSIPPIPYKETTAEFWAQDIMNDWVEQHSPKKELSPSKPRHQPLTQSPSKVKPSSQDLDTKRFKADFENVKEDFAIALLDDLDKTTASGELSKLFKSTGGIKLQWSKALKKTAGQAFFKHSISENGTHHYTGRIELATKVVDDENRLLNTLAHEFCHLATFAISKQTKKPHGPEFQQWGRIVEESGAGLVKRHLERDFKGFRGKWESPKIVIEVSTCHSYKIDFKYEWQCQTPHCGIIYHRHSKSIKPSLHTCGKCKGSLTQIKPLPRKQGLTSTASPFADLMTSEKHKRKEAGQLNEYQQFVRDNMGRIKAENPGSPQKDMMGYLSKSYKEMKASSSLRDGSADLIPKFEGLSICEKKDGRDDEKFEDGGEEEDVFFDADEGFGDLGSDEMRKGVGSGGVIDLVSDDEIRV